LKLAKDKKSLRVNDSLTLEGIPPETFDYRLGNRSARQWVIDQYQVSDDPKSGITSDPNRAGDPEYIVRLVGQVVRVSVETVEIVKNLPRDFGGSTGPEGRQAIAPTVRSGNDATNNIFRKGPEGRHGTSDGAPRAGPQNL
jgi:hypothetical protein